MKLSQTIELIEAAKQPPYWYGFDFDGGLTPKKFEDLTPNKEVVEKAKELLSKGALVKVFTARVSSKASEKKRKYSRTIIQQWCKVHLGKVVPLTAEKDHFMVRLWDDRAREVKDGHIIKDH